MACNRYLQNIIFICFTGFSLYTYKTHLIFFCIQQLVDAKTKQSIEETKVTQLESKLSQMTGTNDSSDSAANLQSVLSNSVLEEEARLIGKIILRTLSFYFVLYIIDVLFTIL